MIINEPINKENNMNVNDTLRLIGYPKKSQDCLIHVNRLLTIGGKILPPRPNNDWDVIIQFKHYKPMDIFDFMLLYGKNEILLFLTEQNLLTPLKNVIETVAETNTSVSLPDEISKKLIDLSLIRSCRGTTSYVPDEISYLIHLGLIEK